jgi:5-methylcytosine-specific restriction endonuclease McrA
MPTTEYKDARTCACGYSTHNPGNWCRHRKSCKLIPDEKDARIATLEQQLADRDEQLKEQREEIKMFEQLLAERFSELREEVKQLRKRKQPVQRVHRTEPQRRKIAKRQNWLCAGEQCREAQPNQELEEYDIDHIIPLHLGGTEELDNLQALCPGCHRRKTDQERIDALMSSNVS